MVEHTTQGLHPEQHEIFWHPSKWKLFLISLWAWKLFSSSMEDDLWTLWSCSSLLPLPHNISRHYLSSTGNPQVQKVVNQRLSSGNQRTLVPRKNIFFITPEWRELTLGQQCCSCAKSTELEDGRPVTTVCDIRFLSWVGVRSYNGSLCKRANFLCK